MLMEGTGCQHWQKPAWQPGGTGWVLCTEHLPAPLVPGVQHHLPWSLPHCHAASTNPDHHAGQQAHPCRALTQLTWPTQPMSWDQQIQIQQGHPTEEEIMWKSQKLSYNIKSSFHFLTFSVRNSLNLYWWKEWRRRKRNKRQELYNLEMKRNSSEPPRKFSSLSAFTWSPWFRDWLSYQSLQAA